MKEACACEEKTVGESRAMPTASLTDLEAEKSLGDGGEVWGAAVRHVSNSKE